VQLARGGEPAARHGGAAALSRKGRAVIAPAAWVLDHREWLPRAGAALDVACGRGRHALWLAQAGWSVVAVDRDPDAIREVAATARRLHLPVDARVLDLEQGSPALGEDRFDAIVVVHYLHRPLFPSLVAALRTGGVLVYETFTRMQALRGRPRNPAFLLEPGELPQLVSPLTVVDVREGEYEGACVASVVARKDGPATAGQVLRAAPDAR
jgi:SAM-dependent methyltransferase